MNSDLEFFKKLNPNLNIVEETENIATKPEEKKIMDEDSDTENMLIGMTTNEARMYAESKGVSFRVGSVDGEFLPVTADFRPGRITADIKGDVIVGYSVE